MTRVLGFKNWENGWRVGGKECKGASTTVVYSDRRDLGTPKHVLGNIRPNPEIKILKKLESHTQRGREEGRERLNDGGSDGGRCHE